MLEDILRAKQDAVGERWLALTTATYRTDTAHFLTAQKNRFANPVGQTLARTLPALVAEVIRGSDPVGVCTHLEEIIKIRAIQDFTPAEAVSFVFLLKDAIRQEIAPDLDRPEIRDELHEIETRIDQIALFAFDIFVKCREKVYSLRLNEIRKGYARSSG